MKYLVIELQTNAEGQVANLVTAFDTKLEAEAKYHTVLAAAATSAVVQHGAVLMTSTGKHIADQCYTHPVEVPTEE